MQVRTILLPVGLILWASGTSSTAQNSTSSVFTAVHDTIVPGSVLKAGNYTIQVVDQLSDRSVVRIASPNRPGVTFLGVSPASQAQASSVGAVTWTKKLNGTEALRGYKFSNGQYLEFVYPKNDAVALANANREAVVAVDPVSENRPELAKLSASDLELVNLWSLTPVKVGPASATTKGIEARRFIPQSDASAAITASRAAVISQGNIPTATAPAVVAELQKPRLEAESTPVRPKVKRLPQTASYTPVLGLLGLFSLSSALWMRRREQSTP